MKSTIRKGHQLSKLPASLLLAAAGIASLSLFIIPANKVSLFSLRPYTIRRFHYYQEY
jgi:hypothetical protein